MKEEEIGGWVGIYSASFFAAQFVASFLWGIAADRWGRRPCLLIGVLGSAVGILLFGLNHSMATNIGARVFQGLLNGNIGTSKTYLGEIVDDTNRAYGFSALAFCWGIGSLVSPALGGFLCRPGQKYPAIFPQGNIFAELPYFLPCLCVSFVSIFGFVFGYFQLPETEPFLKHRMERLVREERVRQRSASEADLVPSIVVDEDFDLERTPERPEAQEGHEESARLASAEAQVTSRATDGTADAHGEADSDARRLEWLWNEPYAMRLMTTYCLLCGQV